jgi:hypothetical protein
VDKQLQLKKPIIQIKNYDALMHRYKPEFMPQIRKALGLKQAFYRSWEHPDWKQVIDDKKEGLVVW